TNSGATWTKTSVPHKYWKGVACSADGTKVVAAGYQETSTNATSPNVLYVSSNAGQDWTAADLPSGGWWCVSVSADGSHMAALSTIGWIYISLDGGVSWEPGS